MIEEIDNYIAALIGQPCCRKRIGRGRSLSIGFGKKVYHQKSNLSDSYYGEWEVGSYSSGWRIVKREKILIGSNDALDSISDFNNRLAELSLGRFQGISQPTHIDIRVHLDCGASIDFLAATSESDESFHLFGPSALYIQFSPVEGWKVGQSDQPWTRYEGNQ
jgi:hypothetical protein